jgi:hypothetical protein
VSGLRDPRHGCPGPIICGNASGTTISPTNNSTNKPAIFLDIIVIS